MQNKDCGPHPGELASDLKGQEELRFLIVGKGAEAFDNIPSNVVFTGYLDKMIPP